MNLEKQSFILRDDKVNKVIGAFKFTKQSQYEELIKAAKSKGLMVYIGGIARVMDKLYTTRPFSVDFNCLNATAEEKKKQQVIADPTIEKKNPDIMIELVYNNLLAAKDNEIGVDEVMTTLDGSVSNTSAFTLRMNHFLKSKSGQRIVRAGTKKHPTYKLIIA